MKPAVFQISEGDGSVQLICCIVKSLAAAVALEEQLQQSCGNHTEVTLLGRFDRIESASTAAEILELILRKPIICQSEGLKIVSSTQNRHGVQH